MSILGVGLNTANVGVLDKLKNPFSRDTNSGTFKQQDFKDGFIIKVLDPTKGYEEVAALKTQLTGNFLPHIPFSYGGNQQVTKDYYPGNNEASVQIMGAREEDVTIKGRFYAKRFGREVAGVRTEDSQAEIPKRLTDKLDNIRIQGFPLEISLGEWRRYAVLTRTQWDLKRTSDIEYQMTFSIFSIDKPTRCPIITDSKLVPLELKSPLNDDLVALQDDIQNRQIPDSVPASLVDIIGDASAAIAAAASGVISLIDGLISSGENITDVITNTVGILKNFEAETSRQRFRLGAISHRLNFAGIPVPAAASTSSIISTRISISSDISDIMRQMRIQFTVIKETKPTIRHRVIEGQTLQNLSLIYYGEFGKWIDIYIHNKLTSSVLEAGQLLEIPQ